MTDDELAELKRLAHKYGRTEMDQHASVDLEDDLRLVIVRASSEDASNEYVRAEMERLQGGLLSASAALHDRTGERDEARRLVTMLLEYGTEGWDHDTLPDWARGKQW